MHGGVVLLSIVCECSVVEKLFGFRTPGTFHYGCRLWVSTLLAHRTPMRPTALHHFFLSKGGGV